MAKMQYQGTGRRKSSVARVRLIPWNRKDYREQERIWRTTSERRSLREK